MAKKNTVQPHSIKITNEFFFPDLQKGIYLVVTEAKRIPPHIGMMVDGNFSSLTVKGNEINIPFNVLHKNIQLRKIPSLFVKVIEHPVFSHSFLNELLVSCVTEHKRVEAYGPSCLQPVKTFFKEAFHLKTENIDYLFHLLPALEKNEMILGSTGFFLGEDTGESYFQLPVYSGKEINAQIEKVRIDFKLR